MGFDHIQLSAVLVSEQMALTGAAGAALGGAKRITLVVLGLPAQTASIRPAQRPMQLLIDGPADAPASLLLAHGAGAPMDSPFMAAIATGLAELGWRVVRFEFPYMAQSRQSGQRRAPDRLARLLDAFRQQVAQQEHRPLFIGGKSLGGRMASLLVDELAEGAGVRGCLCFGYPFHPPGKPEQLRTEHLERLRTPTLILQGERDSFGKRAEVESYSLSAAIDVGWIPSGDHSFKPTRSSGLSEAGNWAAAVALADRFGQQLLAGS